jgi:hypothetical protein
MAIPNRSRDKDGEWREKRADTKVENLKQDYPGFRHINGNTKLGTLKDRFGVDSLDEVRKALRKDKN